MSEEPPDYDEDLRPKGTQDTGTVLVFRNPSGEPVAVPTDVVTAAERVYRAYTSHLEGKSWTQIALEEQYPSDDAVKYDVQRYLDEAKSLVIHHTAREMLQLEVARLNELQSYVWPMARKGHVQSIGAAVNIIMSRAKLIGLDPDHMADKGDTSRTVVVPNDEDGYVASLQRAAAQSEQR